jgi:aminopeptidase N
MPPFPQSGAVASTHSSAQRWPGPRQLSDHAPPGYRVQCVRMVFDLALSKTRVQCEFVVRREPLGDAAPIVLWGEGRALVRMVVGGRRVRLTDDQLARGEFTVRDWGDATTVHVTTRLQPAHNHAMLGLYASAGCLLTQCEAEGFRRITWFPDRPDVIAPYAVLLRADKRELPVLLCNGESVHAGELGRNRHYAYWEDPHPKPSYLFAVAAGRFDALESTRHNRSGAHTRIQLWSARRSLPALRWAQQSLLRAIDWDAARFGLPLELSRYMVLAAVDTNCEAMENQGLNIFNAEHVQAAPHEQTDDDHLRVRRIVAHEFFHHWTGNRVTLRDWFQLGLKEGLTTFREQLFAADMRAEGLDAPAALLARAVSRIDDVKRLRCDQWAEDASPLAHPVRLERYVDIANFYTPTVYDKAAEIIRLVHARLGETLFARVLREFLQRHEGTAVSFEALFDHLSAAAPTLLAGVPRWIAQTGRPAVRAEVHKGSLTGTVKVTVRRLRRTVHRSTDGGFVPIRLQLRWVLADCDDTQPHPHAQSAADVSLLDLTGECTSFVLPLPTPEPARCEVLAIDAEAPGLVEVRRALTNKQRQTLALHHPDPVSRWQASQALAISVLTARRVACEDVLWEGDELLRLHAWVLAQEDLHDGFRADLLTLPDDAVLGLAMPRFDPAGARELKCGWLMQADRALRPAWAAAYGSLHGMPADAMDDAALGQRALRNLALSRWLGSGEADAAAAAFSQLQSAACMTGRLGALGALLGAPTLTADDRAAALEQFLSAHAKSPLVLDKWFAAQARCPTTSAVGIAQVMQHARFRLRRPNHVRALLFTFMNDNPGAFHAADGSAYALWQDLVPTIDRFNDELASELVRGFMLWRRLPATQRPLAENTLRSISSRALSSTTRETVERLMHRHPSPLLKAATR